MTNFFIFLDSYINQVRKYLLGDFEIFSLHINEAIKCLESITKPYNYDEMLDKMFGNFCLGK